MADHTPPPRPIQAFSLIKPRCIKCGPPGRGGPATSVDGWTCPKCLSEADASDRNWRGVGAGQ